MMIKGLKIMLVLVLSGGIITAVAFWKGMDSLIFAWVLNLMLMVGVLYGTETLKPRLESGYYETKKWERQGKIYTSFGVHLFRKLLVWSGWEQLHKASNPVDKRSATLKRLEYGTRKSEFGHWIIFFIVSFLGLLVANRYGFLQSLWLFSLNVLLNLYPILVQRYNRPRYMRLIRKINPRQS